MGVLRDLRRTALADGGLALSRHSSDGEGQISERRPLRKSQIYKSLQPVRWGSLRRRHKSEISSGAPEVVP